MKRANIENMAGEKLKQKLSTVLEKIRQIDFKSVSKSKNFKSAIIVFLVLAVSLVAIGQYKRISDENRAKSAEEVALKNMFALAGLPVDEDPVYSPIKNFDEVKDQPLFEGAQDGDMILFFKKSRMAAILRPSEGKIINKAQVVGDIPKEFSDVTTAVSVGIFNGTKQTGLAQKAADFLGQNFKTDVNVSFQDNARQTNYTQTVVVDLSGQNSGLAKSIAALFNGSVDSFPIGEKMPPAMDDFPEILIFLGSSDWQK
jgi:hypothetical protein